MGEIAHSSRFVFFAMNENQINQSINLSPHFLSFVDLGC
jgi:hypothetical protein